MDALEYKYYMPYNLNNMVLSLDCLEMRIYNTINIEHNFECLDIFDIFLNDTNFMLEESDSKIKEIMTFQLSVFNKVASKYISIDFNKWKKNENKDTPFIGLIGNEAIDFSDALPMNFIFSDVSSCDYNELYSFTVVKNDNKKIFTIRDDIPAQYKHLIQDYNESICFIEKDELFNYFLYCANIKSQNICSFNFMEQYLYIKEHIINNYYVLPKDNIFCGKMALLKLRDYILELHTSNIEKILSEKNKNLGINYLITKIKEIMGKRRIFLFSLNKNLDNFKFKANIRKCITTLSKTTRYWLLFVSLFMQYALTKLEKKHIELIKAYDSILLYEEMFITELIDTE